MSAYLLIASIALAPLVAASIALAIMFRHDLHDDNDGHS